MPRHVVIAVDESNDSDVLLRKAMEDHLREDDKVTLFHAFTYDPQNNMGLLDTYQVGQADKEMESAENANQLQRLQNYKEVMVNNGYRNVDTVQADGPAQRAIPQYVNNLDPPATMLLMSSRRMGMIQRFFYGSVSDECLDKCNISVVVIPGWDQDKVRAK